MQTGAILSQNAVRELVDDRLPKLLFDLDPGRADDRDLWLKVLTATKNVSLHNPGVEDQCRELCRLWSRQSEAYTADGFDATWRSISPHGELTFKSLFAWAKEDRAAGLSLDTALEDRAVVGDFDVDQTIELKSADPETIRGWTVLYLNPLSRRPKKPPLPAASEATPPVAAKQTPEPIVVIPSPVAPPPPATARPGKPPVTLDMAIAAKAKEIGGVEVGRWEYAEDHYRVRFDTAEGKVVLPFSKGPSGSWSTKAPAGIFSLYRLKELYANPDAVVHDVEGEKCADTLASLGYLTTTTAGGAQATAKTDLTPLAGRNVVQWLDADKDGYTRGLKIQVSCSKFANRPTMRAITLPGVREGYDIADMIGDRRRAGTADDAIRAEIDNLVDSAPEIDLQEFQGLLVTESLEGVEPEPIPWLRYPHLALQQNTLIVGPTSSGKSIVLMYLIACLTLGKPFFGDGPDCEPVEVLMFGPEDVKNVVNIRARAAGVDLSKFTRIASQKKRDADTGILATVPFSIPDSLPMMACELAKRPGVRVIVLDPVTGAMLDKDINDQAEVRSALQALGAFAEEHNVAILSTTHMSKASGKGTTLNRTIGSVSFQNLVRLMFLLLSDREDKTLKFFLATKSNIGSMAAGRSFHIRSSEKDRDVPVMELVPGTTDADPDVKLAELEDPAKADRNGGHIDEAILTVFEDGQEHPRSEVIERVRQNVPGTIAERTIERHFEKLKGDSKTRGNSPPKAYWSLPAPNGFTPATKGATK
jgi:hypothetical protein